MGSSYFKSFWSSLQSHPLRVNLYIQNILNSHQNSDYQKNLDRKAIFKLKWQVCGFKIVRWTWGDLVTYNNYSFLAITEVDNTVFMVFTEHFYKHIFSCIIRLFHGCTMYRGIQNLSEGGARLFRYKQILI